MDTINHTTLNLNGINIHLAEKGSGPNIILFIHGFPELWYSWRHQILSLSNLGYRCLAPDMRGYGDTDAPKGCENYTIFHLVGDLVALLDAVVPARKVFVVGHDWGGAFVAWHLCLFRPDKVRALVNLSVPFTPRSSVGRPVDRMKDVYGDDYYMCRIQEPGEVEAEFAKFGAKRVLKELFGYRTPGPLFLPKGKCFNAPPDADIDLPSWMTEDDINYYTSKFEKGFTGGLNYYRVMNLNWELTAPWTGCQVKVPTKFIIGDLDLVYNSFGAKNYVHSEHFKKAVPSLQDIMVLDGVAHWTQQEKPDEISKHIADFFSKFDLISKF